MKSILYVEDNQDTAEAVQIILKNKGYECVLAGNGKDGIKCARNNNFDLILLDIMLPDMSGWDIFESIKDKVSSKFAFLSALPVSQQRIEELKKVGVSDYITKPFGKEDLLDRISKMIG